MKKHLIIIILLSINLKASGQYNSGLKFNAGLSRIAKEFNKLNESLNPAVQFAPSGQVGIFHNLSLNSNSILGLELLLVQIGGKDKQDIYIIDFNGTNIGQGTSNTYFHISYLTLPVYYGLKLNKLTLNFGFQGSVLLGSNGRSKGQIHYTQQIVTWDNKSKGLNIDKFDFGPRAGVIFNLTDKLAVEGIYYHGINNILANNISMETWRIRQIIVGLRYNLKVDTKNKEE